MQDIKLAVHAHPTLSEVLDELFKSAKVSLRFSSEFPYYIKCVNWNPTLYKNTLVLFISSSPFHGMRYSDFISYFTIKMRWNKNAFHQQVEAHAPSAVSEPIAV